MASKRQLELADLLGKLDRLITDCRAEMDNHARGRRYLALAAVAANVANYAKQSEAARKELDAILDAAWQARKG
jgi:hypothetical protein